MRGRRTLVDRCCRMVSNWTKEMSSGPYQSKCITDIALENDSAGKRFRTTIADENWATATDIAHCPLCTSHYAQIRCVHWACSTKTLVLWPALYSTITFVQSIVEHCCISSILVGIILPFDDFDATEFLIDHRVYSSPACTFSTQGGSSGKGVRSGPFTAIMERGYS